MSPSVNTYGGIGSDICVKVDRTKTLAVVRGELPSDWGEEISRKRRSLFSVIEIVGKAVISRDPDGDQYGYHLMDGLGSSGDYNEDSSIFRCISSRSRSGVDLVAPNSEALRVILAALPAVETREKCIWRR